MYVCMYVCMCVYECECVWRFPIIQSLPPITIFDLWNAFGQAYWCREDELGHCQKISAVVLIGRAFHSLCGYAIWQALSGFVFLSNGIAHCLSLHMCDMYVRTNVHTHLHTQTHTHTHIYTCTHNIITYTLSNCNYCRRGKNYSSLRIKKSKKKRSNSISDQNTLWR